jgi:thioredoxin
MILSTNLKHIADATELQKVIKDNKNVMICCGRMGPMCIPVYGHMEELENGGDYKHVTFRDMAFDNKDAVFIRNHKMCSDFMGLPFTVYFQDGKMVHATSSIQSQDQVVTCLDDHLK